MIYRYVFAIVTLAIALYITPFGGLKRLKGIRSMSEEERSKIRLKALGVNISVMLILLAAIFFASGVATYFRENLFKWFMIGWFVLGACDVAFISKSKHYVVENTREVEENENQKEEK